MMRVTIEVTDSAGSLLPPLEVVDILNVGVHNGKHRYKVTASGGVWYISHWRTEGAIKLARKALRRLERG